MSLSKGRDYKLNIKRYLKELSVLSNSIVTEESLLSNDETELIRKESLFLNDAEKRSLRMDFKQLSSAKFKEFIFALYEENSSPVYVWTNLTNICGTFEVSSLKGFNFSFRFDANREGIIVLLAKNNTDRMLLDFYEDNDGQQKTEVEISGANWIKPEYFSS